MRTRLLSFSLLSLTLAILASLGGINRPELKADQPARSGFEVVRQDPMVAAPAGYQWIYDDYSDPRFVRIRAAKEVPASMFINANVPPAPPVQVADVGLPPVYQLPPDEVPQIGTLAEVKSEVARELGYGAKVVKAPESWAKNPKAKGKGIKVAVLDTGCDINHPWVKANVKGTYNAINKTRDVTDRHGHGTHCIGTVVESAPEVEIYVVKVLSDSGSGSVVDIAHGIDYAVSTFKVDVVSLSLGGSSPDSYMPPAIQRGEEAGTLFSCAAGNEGPGANTDGWPARYAHVISVAATDENNNVARFSSRGISVYTATPGVNIVSSLPNGKQGAMSGTSMSTPLHAAGQAIWCACNDVERKSRPDAYRLALKNAGKHPEKRNTDDGYGIPDFTKLVPASGGEPEPPPVDPPAPGKPFSVTLKLSDLSAAKQAELAAAGINTLSLTLGGAGPVVQPPAPMPPPVIDPPAPAPAPVPGGCVGGVCPTFRPVQQQQSSGWYLGKWLGR